MADDLTVLVVPASTSQLPHVKALLAEAELPEAGLELHFPAGYVVALGGGKYLGTAGVETYGRDGLLRSVVVAKSRRGTGMGHTLVFDRIRWAKRRELDSLWLLTTTAAPFFARIGFVTAPRTDAPAAMQASKEFSEACPASAPCMRLDLAGLPSGAALVAWLMQRAPKE